MHADVEERPKCMIVRLSGDLRFWKNVGVESKFLSVIQSHLDHSKVQVLLNLAGLTHIDTRAIAALGVIPIQCMKRRLVLSIVLPSNTAGDAIRRTRVLSPCPTYADEATGLRAIEGSEASA